MSIITELKTIAYDSHVSNCGMYHTQIKEGNVYYYMERDGTLTSLGKCLYSHSHSSMCWHDGPYWSESLKFENTSEKRYNIYRGGSSGGGSRLPIIEQSNKKV
jgi:hypothetical protein